VIYVIEEIVVDSSSSILALCLSGLGCAMVVSLIIFFFSIPVVKVKIVLFSPALLFFKYCEFGQGKYCFKHFWNSLCVPGIVWIKYSLTNFLIFDVSGNQSIGKGVITKSFKNESEGTQDFFNATIEIEGCSCASTSKVRIGVIANSFNNKGNGIQNFSNATIIIINGCCCGSVDLHGIVFYCFFVRALVVLLLILPTRVQHPSNNIGFNSFQCWGQFPSKGTSTPQ